MLKDQLEAKSVQGGSRGCFPPPRLPEHSRRGESHPGFWNPFSHQGGKNRVRCGGFVPQGHGAPLLQTQAAELGSGSPKQAVEVIPASSECLCSCGARSERDEIYCLYVLSFCFPSSSSPDPTLTSQALSVVTLQTLERDLADP